MPRLFWGSKQVSKEVAAYFNENNAEKWAIPKYLWWGKHYGLHLRVQSKDENKSNLTACLRKSSCDES
jgi:hypothetical protein